MKEFCVITCDICHKKIEKYVGLYKFKKIMKDSWDGTNYSCNLHMCSDCFVEFKDQVLKKIEEESEKQ